MSASRSVIVRPVPADAVTAAFRDWGRANGFTRKGTTLYRDQPETLAVVNLQGSQWGGRSYLNVALWLKAVGEAEQPPENKCHIRARLNELVPDPDEVDRVLTDEGGLDDTDRSRRFRAMLDEHLTPLLASTGTLPQLKANRPGFLDKFLLGRDALPLLNDQ
jgi:hypothetical protein